MAAITGAALTRAQVLALPFAVSSGVDARRDLKLARAGYRVVRLQAELVMRDLPAAVLAVRRALSEP